MKIVVLSPHPDDAALSIGATIARRAAAGDDVVVVTVCSGVSDPARLVEDRTAIERLGARGLWLGAHDAPLRGIDVSWSSLCDREPDADFVAEVRARIAVALVSEEVGGDTGTRQRGADAGVVWAPLSCGGHVDHRAVVAAALDLRGVTLALYEDRPYARQRGAVGTALARLGATSVEHGDDVIGADDAVHFASLLGAPALSLSAVPTAMALGERRFQRVAQPVGAFRRRRQRAIDAHESQRAQVLGPADTGGWPWDDEHEGLWLEMTGSDR